jgi:hypothetical protein
VQDVFGMPSKRNRVLENDSETEETETDSGLTVYSLDLVHLYSIGLQGVERYFIFKPPHGEDKPFPPTGSKYKIVITGLKKANEYGVICSAKNKPVQDLNVQSAMWDSVSTWIRFKKLQYRCFMPNHNSETNTSQEKGDYTSYHFSLCTYIF